MKDDALHAVNGSAYLLPVAGAVVPLARAMKITPTTTAAVF